MSADPKGQRSQPGTEAMPRAASKSQVIVAGEVTIGDRKYWPIRRVAEVSHYTTDYIAYLCRRGQVTAVRIGPNWMVEETSARRLATQRDHRDGTTRGRRLGIREWLGRLVRRNEDEK